MREYKSHILTSKQKITYDIYNIFQDNNIKLLDCIFKIFTVILDVHLIIKNNKEMILFYKLYFCNRTRTKVKI